MIDNVLNVLNQEVCMLMLAIDLALEYIWLSRVGIRTELREGPSGGVGDLLEGSSRGRRDVHFNTVIGIHTEGMWGVGKTLGQCRLSGMIVLGMN